MANLHITIDELILDGASHIDQAQLVQAIQQALAQRVAVQGLPTSVNMPEVRPDADGFSIESVAAQVVQAIYGGQK
jgi:hypothetical protein